MSMLIIAALSLAGAAPATTETITASDRPQVAEAAQRINVPTRALYRAVTVRETPRRSVRETRLCLRLSTVVEGKTGRICRTRNQWASFGLTIAPAG